MKTFYFLALSGFSFFALPAFAQQTGTGKMPTPQQAAPIGTSLRAHLQLKATQIEELNVLYDTWIGERGERDRFIAQRQEQLRRAQAPQNFDERAATQLARDINDAQAQNSADFLQVRASALKILTSVQRAQLEAVAKDARLRIRDDQYSQLLLTPLNEEVNPVSASNQRTENSGYDARYNDSQRTNTQQRDSRRQRNRRSSTGGSYGVYGGYGYGGPNYGVYGNYGQGNVGVGATIGRYGPSIGINVGRVFGGRWLR